CRAASPIALNTRAQISPKAKPAAPSAKVTIHTPYQPVKAVPLIEITLPDRKLMAEIKKPSPIPISVEYFNTVSAAFRHGAPFLISGNAYPLANHRLTEPGLSQQVS